MARPLRIEFPGAIYHVMSRGNARQKIVRDDHDYQQLLSGLQAVVATFAWQVMSFVWMPSHFHLFLQTPQPNLSARHAVPRFGLRQLWFARRHQRPGHLLQGPFKGELVEDSTYFWSGSRYLHLKAVPGRRPLVAHPRHWPWSSYAGYAHRARRLDWLAYDRVLDAWQGEQPAGSAPRPRFPADEALASFAHQLAAESACLGDPNTHAKWSGTMEISIRLPSALAIRCSIESEWPR